MSYYDPTDYLWVPNIPLWLTNALTSRYILYYDTYKALADKYCDDATKFYVGPDITLDKVNEYEESGITKFGKLSGPFISQTTDKGIHWGFDVWPKNKPKPVVAPDFDYWQCMCTGLMLWQMYHIALAEQFQRFGFLGYYGSKRNN